MSICLHLFQEMLMKTKRNLKQRDEQLELFAEKPSLPLWTNLPNQVRKRVSDLVAQILVESLRANRSSADRKEVVRER
jgi:hypothetical protein